MPFSAIPPQFGVGASGMRASTKVVAGVGQCAKVTWTQFGISKHGALEQP